MEKENNFIKRWIDERLDHHVDARARQWVDQYAKNPDGSLDPSLAYRIDREVHRRGAIGKQLDIYEPLRWTGISFLLSAAVGAGIKATTEKEFARPALLSLLASTALYSSIQLVRLLPRYDAGLRGGVDTAMAMDKFDTAHTIPTQPFSWQDKEKQRELHRDSTHPYDV